MEYELSTKEREFVDIEYQKLLAVVNYVTTLTQTENTSSDKVRRFIVECGIEIYKKM